MPKYEIIEEHTAYLTFEVEADSPAEAKKKVDALNWDDADKQHTEFKCVECWNCETQDWEDLS